MSPPTGRWSDQARLGGTAEERAGHLFKQAKALTGPTPADLSRILPKVAARVEGGGAKPWQWTAGHGTGVVVAGVVVALGVGGATWLLGRPRDAAEPVAAAPAQIAGSEVAGAAKIEEAPTPALVPAPEPLAPRPPRTAVPRGPSPTKPPEAEAQPVPTAALAPEGAAPEVQSALALEARLLATALRQRNEEHAPAASLATLDEYRARFPQGVLAGEERAARVETLVALGRPQEALSALGAIRTSGSEDGLRLRELRLLEGELLAQDERCADALPIFDEILRTGMAGLEERALYARASCRARSGDVEGSRSDLEAYLQKFPGGRFAAAARAALGR